MSLTSATLKTTRVPTRSRQLRDIHVMAHKLGLETREGHDRSEYEATLKRVCGLTSMRRARRPERELVIAYLKRELRIRGIVVDAWEVCPVAPEYSAEELARIVDADDLESLLA